MSFDLRAKIDKIRKMPKINPQFFLGAETEAGSSHLSVPIYKVSNEASCWVNSSKNWKFLYLRIYKRRSYVKMLSLQRFAESLERALQPSQLVRFDVQAEDGLHLVQAEVGGEQWGKIIAALVLFLY